MDDLREERIDAILSEAVADQLAGKPPNIEGLGLAHPDIAGDIRLRWRALCNLRDPFGPMLQVDVDTRPTIGEFEIEGEIGRGGMGIVYRAQQRNPRRPVALKIIRGGPYVDKHAVRMFEREVQALGRLRHPGIAAIYGAGRTDDGRPFFVMELVQGLPLDQYVKERNPALRDRLRLFHEICAAVYYAHQRAVIHRDLKPGNILIDTDGRPKILDFGLARITDADVVALTVTAEIGRIQGTLSYMSPEQAQGRVDEIDVRSDVYSLGVILYELLTDHAPFDLQQTPIQEAIRIICEDTPRHPSTFQRTLRGEPAAIVLKALEKVPSGRYQSVAELGEDIDRHLNQRPIRARPTRLYRRIIKAARRRPARALLVAASLLVVGLGSTVSVLASKRMEQARQHRVATLQDDISRYVHEATWGSKGYGLPDRTDAYISAAEQSLAELGTLEPRSAWIPLQRARLYLLIGERLDQASVAVEQAATLEPRFIAPAVMRELVRQKFQDRSDLSVGWDSAGYPVDPVDLYFCGIAAQLAGDGARATAYLSAVLDATPSHYWALLERSQVTARRDLTKDRTDTEAAIRVRSDDPTAYSELAWLQDGEEKIKTLKHALAFAPDDVSIRVRLALAYRANGDWQTAERRLREIARDDPTDCALGHLGELLAQRGEVKAGLSFLDEAIHRAGETGRTWWTLTKGRILKENGMIDEARRVLQELVKESESTEAMSDLAELEKAAGNLEEALRHHMQVIDSETKGTQDGCSYMVAGRLLEQLGRTAQAEALLRGGLKRSLERSGPKSSGNGGIRSTLAWLLWRQGRKSDVEDIYHESIRAHKGSPTPYSEYATFLSSIGRDDLANIYNTKALGLKPGDEYSHSRLCREAIADAYRRLGRAANACEEYSLAAATPAEQAYLPSSVFLSWAELLLSDHEWTTEQEEWYRSSPLLHSPEVRPLPKLREWDALDVLWSGVAEYGDSCRAARLRGLALQRIGETDQAIESYEFGLKLACTSEISRRAGKSPIVEDWERKLLLFAYCRLLFDKDGNVLRAQEVCRRAGACFATPKGIAASHAVISRLLSESGQFVDAEREARGACELNRADPDNWYALAVALLGHNDVKGALGALESAVGTGEIVPVGTRWEICDLLCRSEETAHWGLQLIGSFINALYWQPEDRWSQNDYGWAAMGCAQRAILHMRLGDESAAIEWIDSWAKAIRVGNVVESAASDQVHRLLAAASRWKVPAAADRCRELWSKPEFSEGAEAGVPAVGDQ